MISQVCREVGMSYCGVTSAMEKEKTFVGLQEQIGQLKPLKMFARVSSPCSSGSPLRNFSGSVCDSDWQWFEMFPKVLKYLKLGDESSFELPWYNRI